jgi:thiol-disulfide isomerase/thioredoxin
MKRRQTLMLGAAGTAAAAAGLGWQLRRRPPPLDDASTALWQSHFDQPDGQPLALAALRGQVLVLNFWATWCPPCVKEMPELDRFARRFGERGVRVLGLAIDSPTPVREFLRRAPVGYTIGLAGFDGTDLSRKLGNDKGALPFTAVFDRSGALVQRKLGETSFTELEAWVQPLL